MKPIVAAVAVLVALVVCVPVQAQTPEIDALRARAEQGEVSAQVNLGDSYATGEGVPQDDVLAYMWYNLAAAQGTRGAGRDMDDLEERLTREQIAEAQRMSREWLEAHPRGN